MSINIIYLPSFLRNYSPMKNRLHTFVLLLFVQTTFVFGQSFDNNFEPFITRPGDVQQLKVLPDGRFLAAGTFSIANDIADANIARFMADGSIDDSFQSNINFTITAIALQEDGKVIVGGQFTGSSAPEGITVLRLNTDGSIDDSFSAGFAPIGTIEAIEIEFNGTILVGGAFNSFDDQPAQGLVRLDASGGLIQIIDLEPTGTVFISDLISLDNGQFYVCGSYGPEGYLTFRNYAGTPVSGFSFSPDFPGVNNLMVGIRDIELNSHGQVVLTTSTFLIRYACVIIETDGSIGPWGYVFGIPMDLAVDSFDNILIAGEYEGVNAVHRFIPGQDLIVYTGGTGCDGIIRQLTVSPTGTYLIGGSFSSFNDERALSLERLDGFGNPVFGFNPTLERPGVIRTTTIVGDQIYIGGDFAMIENHYSPNLARIHLSDGAPDISFNNPGLSYRNIINNIEMDSQGRILLAGTNQNDGDSFEESPIVRILPNGTIDQTLNIDPIPVGSVSKVLPIPGGLIMAAGDFTIFNPNVIVASDAALFTENGFRIDNFSDRFDAESVTDVIRQADGNIVLAGRDISYDNSPPSNLLRLTPTLEVDQSFQLSNDVQCSGGCQYTMHQQANAKLLLAGPVGVNNEPSLIRLLENGSKDPSFNFNETFSATTGVSNGSPRAIEEFSDGRILVTGLFDSIGLTPSRSMAILSSGGTLLESFSNLSFNRQNILDAKIINDDAFLIAGSINNSNIQEYPGLAIVQFTPPGTIAIGGSINTWLGESMPNVEMGLLGPVSGNAITDTDGTYSFTNLPSGNYEVLPMFNTNPLNGVSTLDIIMISRHILGVEELPTAEQILAADVNNSESVTILDMIAIRKLILGIDSSFPGNTSWRFYPSAYQFPDESNPWLTNFPQTAVLPNINVPGSMDINFTGIKVGDVTGDAEVD
jgi:uncharacterized delta-60 repeat protein